MAHVAGCSWITGNQAYRKLASDPVLLLQYTFSALPIRNCQLEVWMMTLMNIPELGEHPWRSVGGNGAGP